MSRPRKRPPDKPGWWWGWYAADSKWTLLLIDADPHGDGELTCYFYATAYRVKLSDCDWQYTWWVGPVMPPPVPRTP